MTPRPSGFASFVVFMAGCFLVGFGVTVRAVDGTGVAVLGAVLVVLAIMSRLK